MQYGLTLGGGSGGPRRGRKTQITVATTGNAGEITFDPISPLDAWSAITGGAGEILLEAA